MAFYDALIAGWNSVTQPPAGVTGSALLVGDTTAQKLVKVKAWTVPAPNPAIVPVTSIINAIVPADFLGLTQLQVSSLTLLLQSAGIQGNPGMVDGSPGTTVRAVFQSIFAGKTTTLANLTALVAQHDNATTSWLLGVAGTTDIQLSDITKLGLT